MGCGFCELDRYRGAEVFLENGLCAFFAAREGLARVDADLPEGVLPGSGVVVPFAHRRSPFELTPDEWAATFEVLLRGRAALEDWLAPDGYTLGWNDQSGLHAHLHVLPRFRDEPLWDQGVRSAIKLPENRRPDPWRRGGGS